MVPIRHASRNTEMNKTARDDLVAVSLIMLTFTLIGALTIAVGIQVKRERFVRRLMQAAIERQDFDLWESDE